MPTTRLIPIVALSLASAPALADDPKDFLDNPEVLAPKDVAAGQPADPIPDPNAVAEAMAMIGAHRLNPRTGCGLPVPATYNAPSWQQRAAAIRRQAFEDCLAGVMAREEGRLRELEARVRMLSDQAPGADWSGVASSLASKWDELETVNDRLNTKVMWADTVVNVLDTFTGPGAPFDSAGPPAYAQPYNPYLPYNPYANRGYRRDSSVSAPGIR